MTYNVIFYFRSPSDAVIIIHEENKDKWFGIILEKLNQCEFVCQWLSDVEIKWQDKLLYMWKVIQQESCYQVSYCQWLSDVEIKRQDKTALYVESHSTRILFSSAGLNVPHYVNGSFKLVPSAKYEHQELLIWGPNTLVSIYSTQLEAKKVHKVILWEVSPKHERMNKEYQFYLVFCVANILSLC